MEPPDRVVRTCDLKYHVTKKPDVSPADCEEDVVSDFLIAKDIKAPANNRIPEIFIYITL